MRDVLEQFLEWHAEHFGDFGPLIDGELLCLANDAEQAIKDSFTATYDQ